MDSEELEEWLGREDSAGAGWQKADETGETIGHERYLMLWHIQCDVLQVTNIAVAVSL